MCAVVFCNGFLSGLHVLPVGKVPAPIPATVTAGAPTAARVLLKQRSEDQSIGRSSVSTGLATSSPTGPSDTSVVGRGAETAEGEAADDHSDKGTYTIELENQNAEEEEARRMIDKVGGVFRDVRNCLLHLRSFLSLHQPSLYFVLTETSYIQHEAMHSESYPHYCKTAP